MDDALTPSLFTQNRVIVVTNAEKTTKSRLEILTDLARPAARVAACDPGAALQKTDRELGESFFPIIEIDPLKPADVARWLIERHKLAPEIGAAHR